jgi:hypothetical protein
MNPRTLARWARAGEVTFYVVGKGHYMEFDPDDIRSMGERMRVPKHGDVP